MRSEHLPHPTRPDVEATYGLDDGEIYIEIGLIDSPLFRITSTASTDVALYNALELLITTGFFERRHLLHAIRWTEWFSPEQIHDEGVRRAAEVICNLRSQIEETSTGTNHDRYQQHSRRRAAT